MNSSHFARLLIVNRGIQLPARYPSTPPTRRSACLLRQKPVAEGPIQPLLCCRKELRDQQRRTPLAAAWISAMMLAFAGIIGLFGFSLARVHGVRHDYQVSTELRHRERQLHQVQRAYRALEAYVAIQAARDFQQPQLSKGGMPAPALKRSNRS
jgi:hypothetical protein